VQWQPPLTSFVRGTSRQSRFSATRYLPVLCSQYVVFTPGCCSVREYSVESQGRPGVASSHVSLRQGVVGAGDSVGGPVRVWSVPSSHEDNRLSWPDRQAVRCASDNTELELNRCDRSDLAGRYPWDYNSCIGLTVYAAKVSKPMLDVAGIGVKCRLSRDTGQSCFRQRHSRIRSAPTGVRCFGSRTPRPRMLHFSSFSSVIRGRSRFAAICRSALRAAALSSESDSYLSDHA
jgi:hypothetical protein